MSKYYRVYADVDLDAIRANCIELMSKTEPSTKALAVVKADGYGHGDVAVSKAVRDLVYGYAVATLDEAVNLRENGINKPILILGYVEPEEYEALVKNEIDATVFDYETAKALNDVALRLGKVAFCHIKVDTGMRRIGLEPDESGVEIVKKIKNLKALNARGLFTHLATADEKDKTAALRQIAKKAMEKDTGARALRSIIEEYMLDIMYEIPKDDNIGSVTITADYIEKKGTPLIMMRGQERLPMNNAEA